jgi:ATP-dependent helicase/DNAse subunit B
MSKFSQINQLNKYDATWVSYSSMSDFKKCPRLYFLRNVFKTEKGNKINTVSPALSLGSAVHNVIEGLAKDKIPADQRFSEPQKLLEKFASELQKFFGKIGGFESEEHFQEFKKRGEDMIKKVIENPGPLKDKTVLLPDGDNGMAPNFYLSEEENIILNGKIDWIQYVGDDEKGRRIFHIYDFKSNKGGKEEDADSLQLPVYKLLLARYPFRLKEEQPDRKGWWTSEFVLDGASYWYLESGDIKAKELPSETDAFEKVFATAKLVSDKRKELNEKVEAKISPRLNKWDAKKEILANEAELGEVFKCHRGEEGCFFCREFEKIIKTLNGEKDAGAEFVGLQKWNETDKNGTEMFWVI